MKHRDRRRHISADAEGHQVFANNERPAIRLPGLGYNVGQTRFWNSRAAHPDDVGIDGEPRVGTVEHAPCLSGLVW
jgi:hypothetical protein